MQTYLAESWTEAEAINKFLDKMGYEYSYYPKELRFEIYSWGS